MAFRSIPDEFPVLRAEGLTLRELAEQDLPAWFARLSDPESAALAGDPLATSMQAVIDGLAYHRAAFREKTGLRWAIVPDELGASVGSVGFLRLDEGERSAELGAVVGRAHWGHGFATRAARAVIDYGFVTLGLSRVEAVALPENARTLRVLRHLAFLPAPEPCPVNRCIAGRRDSVFFSLARS